MAGTFDVLGTNTEPADVAFKMRILADILGKPDTVVEALAQLAVLGKMAGSMEESS